MKAVSHSPGNPVSTSCDRTIMKTLHGFIFFVVCVVLAKAQEPGSKTSQDREAEARDFMQKLNHETGLSYNVAVKATWKFNTNITDENQKEMIEAKKLAAEQAKNRWTRLQAYKDEWQSFSDEDLNRQFFFFSNLGDSVLSPQDFEQLTTLTAEMKKRYGTTNICDYNDPTKCDLSYDPDLRRILRTSRDEGELRHVWVNWRDAVGKPARKQFEESIALKNKAATLNGYESMAEMWLADYESETFEADIENLYKQLQPLYSQMHAYTRRKLREIYGENIVSKRGPIPAHLMGNMWAQGWGNLIDILRPYPAAVTINTTEEMINQNYTVTQMFQMADDFFASLNLSRVPESFWTLSMLEKPDGREVVCHASAWDLYDGKDVRIKQCTEVNIKQFETVHHELGHVQYYMMYKDQPVIFRRGANPGFHEAVGDIMSLSVITPEHLNKIGLLETLPTDQKSDLNFLMSSGLQRIVFPPFAYVIDKWRWDVARGIVTPDNYTCAWWKYRYEFQGIKPPVLRTESDFDPSAKSHINSYTPYIRYFVSYILQFQFHKAACLIAGKYDPNDPLKPLHRCDIYESTEAGNALGDMLRLGRSQSWPVALKAMTGTDKMDASALLEYFKPLSDWLQEDNLKNGEFIGWEGETENFCQPDQASASAKFDVFPKV